MGEPVIVITGAGSGIGQALSAAFSRDGYLVAGVGRSRASLEATAALCAPSRFIWRTADVVDGAALRLAIGEMEAQLGPATAIVANAAIYPHAYFVDESSDEWASVILTNVCGVANACQAVLPGMLDRGRGRIVIVGSLADNNPAPGTSAYSVSKGALHVLNRALVAEIDPKRFPDVLINEFIPNATRTAMSAHGDAPEVAYAGVRRLIDLPAGGPTGKTFWRGKQLRAPMTMRARARQVLRRLMGQG